MLFAWQVEQFLLLQVQQEIPFVIWMATTTAYLTLASSFQAISKAAWSRCPGIWLVSWPRTRFRSWSWSWSLSRLPATFGKAALGQVCKWLSQPARPIQIPDRRVVYASNSTCSCPMPLNMTSSSSCSCSCSCCCCCSSSCNHLPSDVLWNLLSYWLGKLKRHFVFIGNMFGWLTSVIKINKVISIERQTASRPSPGDP